LAAVSNGLVGTEIEIKEEIEEKEEKANRQYQNRMSDEAIQGSRFSSTLIHHHNGSNESYIEYKYENVD